MMSTIPGQDDNGVEESDSEKEAQERANEQANVATNAVTNAGAAIGAAIGGGQCCGTTPGQVQQDHTASTSKVKENGIKKGPNRREIIDLFKQLNSLYGGFFARFNPKTFKYPKTVNGLINIVDLIHSDNLGEVGDKVGNILLDKGLEYISLGEVKAVFDGLDFIYNGTMQGNLEMMGRYQIEIQEITSHYDYSPGTSWRKTLDTYQGLYEDAKQRYIEAYYEENGNLPMGLPK